MARIPLLLAALLFTACFFNKGKIIFIPDTAQDIQQEQPGLSSSWRIIESQSGSGENGIPAWARSYFDRGVQGIEAIDAYQNKYVFVGKNRGDNFNALQQWANGFTVEQDLPRLIVQRVERRFVATASLYPDDEYGEYFVHIIKKVSDEEYPAAVKDHTFWTKQRRIPTDEETPSENIVTERYEFLVVVSIDKEAFQKQMNTIMADTKTATSPTRDQTAAINKIRQTFFEGF